MPFLDSKTHITRKAVFALIIASLIWGASAPVMKWTLIEVPVYTLAFLRFFLASLLLFIFFRPSLKVAKRDWPLLIAAALFGITIHIPLFFFGLRYTSSINAGVIATAMPILVVISAGIFLHEKVTKNLFVAAALGALGVLLIIFEPLRDEGFSPSVWGNLLLFLSILYNVGFEIMCKKLFKNYKPFTVTFYAFLIGSLFFLPIALPSMIESLPQIYKTPNFYIGVPFGIVFTSTLAYAFWQWGLSKLPASKVGFFIYLDPVVAAVVAFFLLHEVITLEIFFGALLIVGALYFAEAKHPYEHLFHLVRKHETDYPHK